MQADAIDEHVQRARLLRYLAASPSARRVFVNENCAADAASIVPAAVFDRAGGGHRVGHLIELGVAISAVWRMAT